MNSGDLSIDPPKSAQTESSVSPSPESPPAFARILLVEDSPSDAALLQESLHDYRPGRFEFVHVERWIDAEARLRREQFDILILDLSLPDIAGRTTFIRARAVTPRLPIVVLSGLEDEAIALEALRHGIQDYLVKGQADGPQIARAIRHAIERHRIEQALKHAEAALRESEGRLRETNLELERRVATRTAQLEETIANLEDFSHSITHDLRAPLRTMRAFAQILQEECSRCVSPAAQENIRLIVSAAARMDKLILGVLQYSRTARSELALVPVDVATLLRGIIQSYPAFNSPGVRIEVQEALPRVIANEAALTQCFSNLLDNAVKFVAPGVQPQVRISALQSAAQNQTPSASQEIPPCPPGFVRLCIADNGIGIPSQARERIFQLFQRLDKSYEGTGVGLAVVRKAVEKMGGAIHLESETGQGSRFMIELKAAAS
jgi:signal transduction histidine kinase